MSWRDFIPQVMVIIIVLGTFIVYAKKPLPIQDDDKLECEIHIPVGTRLVTDRFIKAKGKVYEVTQ